MCTVTFVRQKDRVILTSNRDEAIERPAASMPKEYIVNNTSLYFPQDPKANGSWFAVKKNGECIVLLNGAEEKHISTGNYSRSRGLIVLDILSDNHPLGKIESINLAGVEPFTIIYCNENTAYQLRWNGTEKSLQEVLENMRIWSSSTLYSKEQIDEKENYFKDFIQKNRDSLTADKILEFHQTPVEASVGIILNRENKMLTKNVTQYCLQQNELTFKHFDLITHQQKTIQIP
jgi:hypothetical protein